MTDRTHYRIFPERTGDPIRDNVARRANRRLSRHIRDSFRVQVGGKGRRRKKSLTKTTFLELLNLHLSVMESLNKRANQ